MVCRVCLTRASLGPQVCHTLGFLSRRLHGELFRRYSASAAMDVSHDDPRSSRRAAPIYGSAAAPIPQSSGGARLEPLLAFPADEDGRRLTWLTGALPS